MGGCLPALFYPATTLSLPGARVWQKTKEGFTDKVNDILKEGKVGMTTDMSDNNMSFHN